MRGLKKLALALATLGALSGGVKAEQSRTYLFPTQYSEGAYNYETLAPLNVTVGEVFSVSAKSVVYNFPTMFGPDLAVVVFDQYPNPCYEGLPASVCSEYLEWNGTSFLPLQSQEVSSDLIQTGTFRGVFSEAGEYKLLLIRRYISVQEQWDSDGNYMGGQAFPLVWEHARLTVNVLAVPEPETYAMFLAGLGLLGAVARRRRALTTPA